MSDDTSHSPSRRAMLQAGAATLAAVAAVGLSTRARAQEKMAQTIVQYQTTPKDGAQCSACVNFEPPNACKLVAGTIVATGWCVAFAPKTG